MKYIVIVCLLIYSFLAIGQEREVEYKASKLSDSVYVLEGAGGNIGISTGDDGIYLIDDQLQRRPRRVQAQQDLDRRYRRLSEARS